MSAGCLFDFPLEFLEVCKHFTLLPHGEDPGVPGEVVDERDIISASSECCRLSFNVVILESRESDDDSF